MQTDVSVCDVEAVNQKPGEAALTPMEILGLQIIMGAWLASQPQTARYVGAFTSSLTQPVAVPPAVNSYCRQQPSRQFLGVLSLGRQSFSKHSPLLAQPAPVVPDSLTLEFGLLPEPVELLGSGLPAM